MAFFLFAFMAAGGMGFGWMEENKKSASPKINGGYRGDRGDRTAGGVAGAGVVYGTPSRDGGLFCDYVGVAKWWWMGDFLEEC